MRKLGAVALVLAMACAGSKRDPNDVAAIRRLEERVAILEATKATPRGELGEGTATERLERLEALMARYSDPLEFLAKVYEQQKAQQEAADADEPDPDAVFAVNIEPALRAGQVEGPSSALVTIVEAWDFA